MAVVRVKAHSRSGVKIKSHTRGTGVSKTVGDCSVKGIVKKATQISKMSNAKNPAKTGNLAVDVLLNRIKPINIWNKGFNIGKRAFIAHQTYNETCKKK